jgi:anaerobic magnesium-protoporphyrin IX monomethyl ester cyclase
MRVVLIQPPPASALDRHWARFPVLGLAYLTAAIRRDGDDVVLLDGKLAGRRVAEICDAVAVARPDLVAITAMTIEYPTACRIAAGLKANSAVPIAIGGAHVKAVAEGALEECEHFDFACVGEVSS